MYLPLIQYVVQVETQSDRLHQSLQNAIKRDREQNRSDRKVFRWLGTQMITWGTRLQNSQNIDTGCQETSFSVSVTAH